MDFVVTDTKNTPPRGRPRRFDIDDALAQAQVLFHREGYDGLGVAELTTALGIRPPSFYAAFHSKAALFAKVLERYTRLDGLPITEILQPDRAVDDGLHALLRAAAQRYSAVPEAAGCLVIEGQRALDPVARETACGMQGAARAVIRDFIALRLPQQAEALSTFMGVVMAGMSAEARGGASEAQLLVVADVAADAIRARMIAARD